MKKYLLQFSISTLITISAQSSPFKSFDIVIYPEYYFSGVMAEVEAEIFEGNLPLIFLRNARSLAELITRILPIVDLFLIFLIQDWLFS